MCPGLPGRYLKEIETSVYISPIDIKEYIICPRRLSLQNKIHPEYSPKPGQFLKNQHLYFNREPNSDNIIYACFCDTIKIIFALLIKWTGKKDIPWNTIRTAIGHAMQFRAKLGLAIPKDATRLIELVNHFYTNFLVGGMRLVDIPIYPAFPILVPLGKGIIYTDILHALGQDLNGNILFDFRLKPVASDKYTVEDFQQDTLLGARLWGLKELANELPYTVIIFYFGANGGTKVKSFTLYCKNNYNKYTAQHLINMYHIIQGISKQVSYASRRPDCEYCMYKETCDTIIVNEGVTND